MAELTIIGIGGGDQKGMTFQAYEALEASDVIVGYTAYTELVKPMFPNKEYMTSPMTKEVDRCKAALEAAKSGKITAVICSGDAGVYGMAGLIYELSVDFPEVNIQVIPGVTAATSGAALLGAPLMHDFCVISLSDRLTPMDLIWKRLEAAAEADFVICIYNPSSKTRKTYLAEAAVRLMKYKSPDTICGYAKQIGRVGESSGVLTLKELESFEADMFTTIWIGNSSTKRIEDHMVTPRGYKHV